MKKLFITFFVFLMCLSVFASDVKNLPYGNIKENGKLTITEAGIWSQKVSRKDTGSFIRQGNLLKRQDNSLNIDTKCKFIFLNDGRLFGYDDSIMRFYEFVPSNERVSVKELDIYEVSALFKDFHVIAISDFSKSTNVFKVKKTRGEEKIMLINDTAARFDNYGFSTNNAKYEEYIINNAIGVTKPGMIQFSKSDEGVKNAPWFVLLVRK